MPAVFEVTATGKRRQLPADEAARRRLTQVSVAGGPSMSAGTPMPVGSRGAARMSEPQSTEADEEYEELLAMQGGGSIEACEILGKTRYFKRLKFSEIERIRLSVGRNENGVLNVYSTDGLETLTVELIAACVVRGADDATPVYTLQQAKRLEALASADELVGQLFYQAVSLNPGVVPKFRPKAAEPEMATTETSPDSSGSSPSTEKPSTSAASSGRRARKSKPTAPATPA